MRKYLPWRLILIILIAGLILGLRYKSGRIAPRIISTGDQAANVRVTEESTTSLANNFFVYVKQPVSYAVQDGALSLNIPITVRDSSRLPGCFAERDCSAGNPNPDFMIQRFVNGKWEVQNALGIGCSNNSSMGIALEVDSGEQESFSYDASLVPNSRYRLKLQVIASSTFSKDNEYGGICNWSPAASILDEKQWIGVYSNEFQTPDAPQQIFLGTIVGYNQDLFSEINGFYSTSSSNNYTDFMLQTADGRHHDLLDIATSSLRKFLGQRVEVRGWPLWYMYRGLASADGNSIFVTQPVTHAP